MKGMLLAEKKNCSNVMYVRMCLSTEEVYIDITDWLTEVKIVYPVPNVRFSYRIDKPLISINVTRIYLL